MRNVPEWTKGNAFAKRFFKWLRRKNKPALLTWEKCVYQDLERRGVNAEIIRRMEEKGYKSTSKEESQQIARRLIKAGITLGRRSRILYQSGRRLGSEFL